MRFSLIVPVLNESRILRQFLRHLRKCALGCEIIVVDGKSDDASLEIAREFADRVMEAPRGRALQMNAGANLASGDVLWFVHADSRVATRSLSAIARALANPKVVGGCFRLHVESPRWTYRVRDAIGNLLVDLTGIALGDRGFFCRRDIFFRVRGYPEISLLEDAEFYRALKRHGRVVQLREVIGTSPRRYEALGPTVTMLFYAFIMLLYAARVPIRVLEGLVRAYMNKRLVAQDR
jgi:rSAM/selenodomain-associated transferase 2